MRDKEVGIRIILADVLWFVPVYFVLLLRWGYIFGSGDQVEVLPYVAKLHDYNLFSKDLFVNQLASQAFNQRWGTAQLIAFFGDFMQVGVYLLFIVCLYFLVTGLRRLWAEVIASDKVHPIFEFFFVVIVLLLSQGWSPGGNDLYSESFIPDSVATPLVVWGLLYYKRSRFLLASVLIGAATFFQPLLGFQVFVIMWLSGLYVQREWLISIKQFIIFIVSGGWLFCVLLLAMFTGAGEPVMNDYFDVYFVFRAPHHFLPSAFLTYKSAAFLILWLVAIFGLYREHKSLSIFLLVSLIGCVFYVVMVEGFSSGLVASTQWFKTTQWVKLFGILSVFSLIKPWLVKLSRSIPMWIGSVISLGSIAGILILMVLPGTHPLQKRNDLVQSPINMELYDYVKNQTDIGACFVVPLENSDFKIGASRSVFVDFKSVDPKKSFVKEWKRRIELVYGSIEGDKGFEFGPTADNHYQSLEKADFELLAAEGVTHVLYKRERMHPSLDEVFSSESYYVYELKK